MTEIEKPLTVKDIAPVLGVSTRTIYGLAKRGALPSFTLPGSRLRFFRAADVAEWLARLDAHGEVR